MSMMWQVVTILISDFSSVADEIWLSWDVTQRRLVVSYRRFGTTYLSYLGLLGS
jgi:hypothetical protein